MSENHKAVVPKSNTNTTFRRGPGALGEDQVTPARSRLVAVFESTENRDLLPGKTAMSKQGQIVTGVGVERGWKVRGWGGW